MRQRKYSSWETVNRPSFSKPVDVLDAFILIDLQDVESNVRTLRNYIDEFSSSKDATKVQNPSGKYYGAISDDVNMQRKIPDEFAAKD